MNKIIVKVRILISVFLIISFNTIFAQFASTSNNDWDYADKIIKSIILPEIKNTDYVLTKFGAIADGETDCLPVLNKVIDICNSQGGGKIIFTQGTFYLKGPIHLKSNINLVVSENAHIKFSSDPKDYLPVVFTRWEGTECYNYSPFIYANSLSNVAITGKGTIDGNAEKIFATWKPDQKNDQLLLRQMGNDRVPIYERVFGEGHFLRPVMIQFVNCKNVLVEDIKIIDSPFWVIHPVLSYNVTVRKVNVTSSNLNNDGCDPECSVNVLIENCEFNTGDDAIAIKAGRDQDGWQIGQSTENIVIRNCKMNSNANGLCIGSEMSGGVRNVFMEDCIVSNVASAIYFKSNLDRGGFIENIRVRNIDVNIARDRCIAFETNYHGYRGNFYPPRFNNFIIENIKCKDGGKYAIFGEGVVDSKLTNIILKNVTVEKAEVPYHLMFTENFILDNVKIEGEVLPMQPQMSSERVPRIENLIYKNDIMNK